MQSVSTCIARNLLARLPDVGMRQQEFCRATGISLFELQDWRTRVSAETHFRMQRVCSTLGILPPPREARMAPDLDERGVIAPLVLNSRDLDQAYRNFLWCRPIVGTADDLHYRHESDTYEFRYLMDNHDRPAAYSAVVHFCWFIELAKFYAHDCRTVAFELTARPAEDPSVSDLTSLDVAVRFRAAHNRLVLRVPEKATFRFNPALYELSRLRAEKELHALPHSYSLAHALERVLTQLLQADPGGVPDNPTQVTRGFLHAACERLELSRTKVQRQLAIEGRSFRSILQSVRTAEAARLLLQSDLPLTEIAARIGFGSLSAFSRFFHGVHGLSPAAYRRLAANSAVPAIGLMRTEPSTLAAAPLFFGLDQ